jgi:hypothetical protein
VLERIEGSDEVMEAIKKRLKAGTVLVTTDLPATPDTQRQEHGRDGRPGEVGRIKPPRQR